MSSANLVERTFFETTATGKALLPDVEVNANFSFRMLSNGNIVGNIGFTGAEAQKLFMKFDTLNTFELEGTTNKNEKVTVSRCHCTHTQQSISNNIDIKCTFSARKATYNADILKTKSDRKIIIVFAISNMHKVFDIQVPTSLGQLSIHHEKNMDRMIELMQVYKIPMVTSFAEIRHSPDGTRNLEQILDEATQIIKNFLKITSLAQIVWHSWSYVQIFQEKEKDSTSNYPEIFRKLRAIQLSYPASSPLANEASSTHFIASAWRGYSSQLTERFGFNYALQWYVASNSPPFGEGKLLNATTAFELLLSMFHRSHESEYYDGEAFEAFHKRLIAFATDNLKDPVFDGTRAAITGYVSSVNRRSYSAKAEELLKCWKISVADLEAHTGLTLSKIIKIRDKIIHSGRYEGKKGENTLVTLVNAHYMLFSILTRLFLAMLNYDWQYYDIALGRTVNFPVVCSRAGKSPGTSPS